MLLGVLLAFVVGASAGRFGFDLALIGADVAARHGAKCLDGSVPGYYRRIGVGENATKWRIHLRGGGWCLTDQSCAGRASSQTGSSKSLPANIGGNNDDSPFGLMNTSEPHFGSWTTIFAEYCDGSSFTSNRDLPLNVSGKVIWMRGKGNLDALLDDLTEWGGLLRNATDVILTGTSAGGMATFLHARYVRSLLPPSTKMVAAPDAGFFLWDGGRWSHAQLQSALALWNSTLDPACTARVQEAFECLLPQNALRFMGDEVPVFVLQSSYDVVQSGCSPSAKGCNESMAAYSKKLLGVLQSSLTPSTAIFATSCRQHEESCVDLDWDGIRVDGVTPSDAFAQFYFGNRYPRHYDVPWPGNPSCSEGVRHGGC